MPLDRADELDMILFTEQWICDSKHLNPDAKIIIKRNYVWNTVLAVKQKLKAIMRNSVSGVGPAGMDIMFNVWKLRHDSKVRTLTSGEVMKVGLAFNAAMKEHA